MISDTCQLPLFELRSPVKALWRESGCSYPRILWGPKIQRGPIMVALSLERLGFRGEFTYRINIRRWNYARSSVGRRYSFRSRAFIVGSDLAAAFDAAERWHKLFIARGGVIEEQSARAIEQRVIEMLGTRFDVPPAEITRETTLTSLGLDSIDAVELVIDLEDWLGFFIPDEIADMTTVGDIIEYLERHLPEPDTPNPEPQ